MKPVRDDNGVIQPVIAPASNGIPEKVPHAIKSFGPSSLKVGMLDPVRVFDEPVTLADVAVVAGHIPRRVSLPLFVGDRSLLQQAC